MLNRGGVYFGVTLTIPQLLRIPARRTNGRTIV
jgi:hypothetical protein